MNERKEEDSSPEGSKPHVSSPSAAGSTPPPFDPLAAFFEFAPDESLRANMARFRPDATQPDDDIVLRAFDEHARTSGFEARTDLLTEAAGGGDDGLEPLLGRNAVELVNELSATDLEFGPGALPPSWDAGVANPAAEFPAVLAREGGAMPAYSWDGQNGEAGLPIDILPSTSALGGARAKTIVRELVETGLLALLVFLAVRASFQNFKVDGLSMFPTLENGQFLIVNKLVYSEVNVDKLSNFIPFLDAGKSPKRYVFHGPQRGDIIVLQDPRKPDTDLIKRVIGLPGETLEIVNGQVYINGFLLEEPYLKPWHDNRPKVTIPVGEYFVMGDNRDNSLDSRSPSVGLVPKELIIGKTMLSYWPSEQFGLAPNESPRLTNQPLSAARPGESATTVKTGP